MLVISFTNRVAKACFVFMCVCTFLAIWPLSNFNYNYFIEVEYGIGNELHIHN